MNAKRHGNIPTGTPITGASNAGGVGSNRDSEAIYGFIACCQRCDRLGVINTAPPTEPWQVVTLTAASKRRSLLMAGGRRRRNVYDKKSQRYAKDNRTAFNCTQ